MSDTVPVFEEVYNKNIENNNDDYIRPRISVSSNLWNLFKFVTSIQNKKIIDTLNEAIRLWIDINNLSVSYKCCRCDKNIDVKNDFFTRKKNNENIYYCSFKCLVENYNK